MSKFRVFYIISLVILGLLLVFTVFRPLATGEEYTEVQLGGLLQAEDEWVIQFDLINHEGEDKKYTINILIDGELISRDFLVRDGNVFTYIHHVYPERMNERNVSFTIYKEGEEPPFEQVTYYLK